MSSPKRRTQPNTGIIGSFMPHGLFDAIDAATPPDMQKHIFFDQVFREFIRAWNRGAVPRVYIGTRKEDGEQRSFYINRDTINAAKVIADADGVAVSHVLRTAIAWYLYRRDSRADRWGSDQVLGQRPKVEI